MLVNVRHVLSIQTLLWVLRQFQTVNVLLDFLEIQVTNAWRALLGFTVPTCQSIFVAPVPLIRTMSWILAQMWERACPVQKTQKAQPDLESRLTVYVTPDSMPPQQQIVVPGYVPPALQGPIPQPPIAPPVNSAQQVHILQPRVPPPPTHAFCATMVHTHYQPAQSSAPFARFQHGKTLQEMPTPAWNAPRAQAILSMESMEV